MFGRRGSGKSTLLLTAKIEAESQRIISVYFDSELIKSNPFPDILIELLNDLFTCLLINIRSRETRLERIKNKIFSTEIHKLVNDVRHVLSDLVKLKNDPESYLLSRKTTQARGSQQGVATQFGDTGASIRGHLTRERSSAVEDQVEIVIIKEKGLQQDLPIYQGLLSRLLDSLGQKMMLFLDDFYFIPKNNQPDVIDYLHRLSKGTQLYLKIGTIKYRSNYYRTNENGTICGVQLNNDIFPIDLDYTLENFEMMSNFLDQILCTLASRAGINETELNDLFTDGGKRLLHIASGGVPRDFLNLFLIGQRIAKLRNRKKLDKLISMPEAARQYYLDTKIQNLREDVGGDSENLEHLIEHIQKLIVLNRKKTVFLVDQEASTTKPEEYNRLKQLMDLRFVHLVESSTSATYGGRRRYEAYLVDAGLWSSPKVPGLIEVAFYRTDSKGRKDKLRSCPQFKL